MYITTAITGAYEMGLPAWGRSFWQDPNDGELFLAFASGGREVNYIRSGDSGVTWSSPSLLFPVDDFSTFNNFDTFMDYQGHIHAGFALNGSGCYQFFGKVPGGGWTSASGGGVKAFNNYYPTGRTKGWNGTITRLDVQPSFSDYTVFPLILIANKNSHGKLHIHSVQGPFNGDIIRDFMGTEELGAEGGYPILMNSMGENNAQVVAISGSNIIRYNEFTGWQRQNITYVPNGFRLYDHSLCYGSGAGFRSSAVVVNSTPSGADMWAVADVGGGAGWVPVLSGYMTGSAAWRGAFTNDVLNSTSSGTNVDFTFTDELGVNKLYFQDTDGYGSTCIKRVLAQYVYGGYTTPYAFSDITHSISGVKEVATVDRFTSGGVFNIGYWKKFKAVKHPVSAGIRPNPLHHKGEFIVTHSHPPISSSGDCLNIFNVADSPHVHPGNFPLPSVYRDYSEDLLTTIVASGGFINGSNLFDRTSSTAATLSSTGGFLTLEFDRPLHINKVHFAKGWNQNWGTLSVSGSFDNTDWRRISGDVFSVTFDELVYLSSNSRDNDAFGYLKSPVCKYLKFHWTGSASTLINEIRVYGKGSTRVIDMTGPNAAGAYSFVDREIRKERSRNTEKFVYQQDSIPAGFEVYGDVGWGVKASGAFAADNFLPGGGLLPGGKIPSGTYEGDGYGNGDGFSMQNALTSVSGASGVLQYSVYIDEPRRITFYKKADLHPEDKFEFYTVSPGGPGSGTLWTQTLGTNHDWTSVSTTPLAVGTHLLKWIYTRGGTTTDGIYGAAWIDDLVGLDITQPSIYGWLRGDATQISGSIHSYMDGSDKSYINAFMSGTPLTSYINSYLISSTFINMAGSIDAYMKGKGVQINSYMLGSDGPILSSIPTGTIHAIMGVGADNKNSTILSFLAGTHATFIHGYLRAADDVFTPTVSSGNTLTGDFSINAYMLANKPFSSIHAIVNAPSGTPSSSIDGYTKGFIGDQSIHAHLLSPSGFIDSRDAYMQGWDGSPSYFNNGPQSMVYAYMHGPISSGTATIHTYMLAKLPNEAIHAYMGPSTDIGAGAIAGGPGAGGASTSGVSAGQNWINTFLKGFDGSQLINAYIMGPNGGYGSIDGYMMAGAYDNRIWGYLPVWNNASGVINSYASGIGFGSQSSHAYLFGASGIISEAIDSFMTGHENSSAIIWGSIQGAPGAASGDCLFFGLVPENPGVIPSNTYPGMLI